MNMNKQFLAKITSIIILILAFIDTNLQVLQGIGLEDLAINWIKFSLIAIAALLPAIPLKYNRRKLDVLADVESESIAGGGIKPNPK